MKIEGLETGSRVCCASFKFVLSGFGPGFCDWIYEQGFWRATWIQGICEDLFREGSEFKQNMELGQKLTQIRIGILRERTDALPSAPGKSAS
jgi:hypothetical protein